MSPMVETEHEPRIQIQNGSKQKKLRLNIIQYLNSKLGITLRVSVTFATKRTIHKNT